MLQKVEGIILRTVDYGETNKIVTLYTREAGKIALFANGAKKTRSRIASVTQPFTYGTYLFFAGKGLGRISQGDIIDSFRNIQADLFRTAYAAYVLELLDKLTEERSPNPFLFELFYQTLHYIDDEVDPEVMTFIFEVKMLEVAGIRPKLEGCARCGRHDGPFVFSISEGGLLCPLCKVTDAYYMKISNSSLKLLRLFLQIPLQRLGKVSLKAETRQEIKTALSAYYDEYSGLKLKSRRFLDQLEKMEPGPS